MLSSNITEEIFNRLFSLPDNKACIDCTSSQIEFCSINHGLFLCPTCAECHKKFKNGISIIKSIKKHSWTENEMNLMIIGGNMKFKIFLVRYRFPKEYTLEEKYTTRAVCYYREMLFLQLTNSLVKEAPDEENGILLNIDKDQRIYSENDINPKLSEEEEIVEKTWGFFSKVADITKLAVNKVKNTVQDPNFHDEMRFYRNKISDQGKEIGTKAFNFFKGVNINNNSKEINKNIQPKEEEKYEFKNNDNANDNGLKQSQENLSYKFPEDNLDKTLFFIDKGVEKITQINYSEKFKNFGVAVADFSKKTYQKINQKIEDPVFQEDLKNMKENISHKTKEFSEKTASFAEKTYNNLKIKIEGDPKKKLADKYGEESVEYQDIMGFEGNSNLKEYMINSALTQKK